MKHFRRLTTSNESVGATDLIEEVKDASEHPAFQAMDDHTQSLLDHTEEVHQMATDSIAAVDLDEHLEQVQAIQDESASAALSLSVLPIVEALRMRHDPQAKRRSVTMESLRHNHRRGMQAVRESLGDTIAQLWHKIWEFIKKSGEFIMSLVKAAFDWVAGLFTSDKSSHLTSTDSRGISGLLDRIKNAASDNEAIQMLGGRATTESYVASMERDTTGAHTQAQKVVASVRQKKAFFSPDDLRTVALSGFHMNELIGGERGDVVVDLNMLGEIYYHVSMAGVSNSSGVRKDMDKFVAQIKADMSESDVKKFAKNIDRTDANFLEVGWLIGSDENSGSKPDAKLVGLLKKKGQAIPERIGLTPDPLIGAGFIFDEPGRISGVRVHRVNLSRSDVAGDVEKRGFYLDGDAVECLKKSKQGLIKIQQDYKANLENYRHLGKLLTDLDIRKFQNEEVDSGDYATICRLPKMLTAYVRTYAIDLEGYRNYLAAAANVHNALVPVVLFLDRKAKENGGHIRM